MLGCAKEPLLGDLELNKWEAEVPNYITVDSSNALVVNPSDGDIWVYFSFDQALIEQEWGEISGIAVVYQRTTWPFGSAIKCGATFSNGQGVFSPTSTTSNGSNYNFELFIVFKNGRRAVAAPIYTVSTPPF
jgi:hypothetical protein